MSLFIFLEAIVVLALGLLLTFAIFATGHRLFDDMLDGDTPDLLIIGISILIWLSVSYLVIARILG